MRRALAYVVPYWRRLALVLALSLTGTALSLYLPLLSRDLVDRALVGRDTTALFRIIGAFTLVTLASFALNVVSGLRYTRVSAEILFDMRLAVYRHLQQLSPRFFARTRLGDILSRINGDISEVQRVAAEVALAWVGNVLFIIGTVGMLAWLDLKLFAVGLVFVPVTIWALVHFRKKLEANVTRMRERSADIGSFLIETLQGVRLVVTSNAQDRERERFGARNAGFIDALMSMQRLTYFSGGVPGLILSAGSAAVFLAGGWQVIEGRLTLGTFVAFLAYQMRLMAPVQALMGLYASVGSAQASLRRVYELLDVEPEVRDRADAAPLARVGGDVAFEDVSFTFDGREPVLQHVSFTARAGEVLALVGPSGSGKSTVADLLLRLLDPDAGCIRLDGHDLKALRLEDVRRHVVLVDQEPFLFHATIGDNLRYVRPSATDEEIAHAARAAALDELIARLPLGYATVVGERGVALSAGERQRIALARAFLADPAVLVMDEPTASLDPVSERRVLAGYEAIMRGRTTLVISHRLGLARRADRVLVIDNARIVEDGRPADLERRDGPFTRLFHERGGVEGGGGDAVAHAGRADAVASPEGAGQGVAQDSALDVAQGAAQDAALDVVKGVAKSVAQGAALRQAGASSVSASVRPPVTARPEPQPDAQPEPEPEPVS
jgi:ATP-binding cassette subfamily B protein